MLLSSFFPAVQLPPLTLIRPPLLPVHPFPLTEGLLLLLLATSASPLLLPTLLPTGPKETAAVFIHLPNSSLLAAACRLSYSTPKTIKRHPPQALYSIVVALKGVYWYSAWSNRPTPASSLPIPLLACSPFTLLASRTMSTAVASVAAPPLTQPSTAQDASPKSTYPAPSTHTPTDRNSATSTAANANTPIIIGEGVAQQKSTPDGKRSPNS